MQCTRCQKTIDTEGICASCRETVCINSLHLYCPWCGAMQDEPDRLENVSVEHKICDVCLRQYMFLSVTQYTSAVDRRKKT